MTRLALLLLVVATVAAGLGWSPAATAAVVPTGAYGTAVTCTIIRTTGTDGTQTCNDVGTPPNQTGSSQLRLRHRNWGNGTWSNYVGLNITVATPNTVPYRAFCVRMLNTAGTDLRGWTSWSGQDVSAGEYTTCMWLSGIAVTDWEFEAEYSASSRRNEPLYWWWADTPVVGTGESPDMAPEATPIGPPVPTCTRTLSQNNGANVGTFAADFPATEGIASATYSWGFGDSSTPAVGSQAQHIYGALSVMPGGGWTATVTATYTATEGYELTTVTAVCSLRVDFLNPTQSVPGTDLDDVEDDDCPTGFGWLNPLAIVDILKCLFIPQTSGDNLRDLWGNVETRAPFSWAWEVVSFPGQFLTEVAEHASEAECGPIAVFSGSGGMMDSGVADGGVVNTCSMLLDPTDPDEGNFMGWFRIFFYWFFVLAMGIGLWMLVSRFVLQ